MIPFERRSPRIGNYVIVYFVCVAANNLAFVLSMGFLLLPCFIITLGPLLFLGFSINRRIIRDTRIRNPVLGFMCKCIASLLVWFIAFLPFTFWGIEAIADTPNRIARHNELEQLQAEMENYETYVDLTPFGLGLYKRQNEGDRYLWDITKPEDHVIKYEGTEMVYESHVNRKDYESWDDTWGNSNVGKDVTYDIYFYEGIYLIVTPLWEKPGSQYHWGHIYLCETISKESDLYDIGILDPAVVEHFSALPRDELSRKELAEKLGKAF